MSLNKYNKAIIAVIGAALTWALANYSGDPQVSQWLSLATAILTALGVYQVPNKTNVLGE